MKIETLAIDNRECKIVRSLNPNFSSIVLFLHGGGETASDWLTLFSEKRKLIKNLNELGYNIVIPTADKLGTCKKKKVTQWGFGNKTNFSKDVSFIKNCLKQVGYNEQIKPRVHVVGISNGAFMSSALVDNSDINIVSQVIHSGGHYSNYEKYNSNTCLPVLNLNHPDINKLVNTLLIHGKADKVVSWKLARLYDMELLFSSTLILVDNGGHTWLNRNLEIIEHIKRN